MQFNRALAIEREMESAGRRAHFARLGIVALALVMPHGVAQSQASAQQMGQRLVIGAEMPIQLRFQAQQYSPLAPERVGSTFRIPQSQQRRSDESGVEKKAQLPEGLPKTPFPVNGGGKDRATLMAKCMAANEKLNKAESDIFEQKSAVHAELKVAHLRSPYLIDTVWNLADPAERQQFEEYKQAIRDYDHACLVDPIRAPGWGMPALNAAVGYLSEAGPPARKFCTAFRISTTRIATARHCFYDSDTNQMDPSFFKQKAVVFSMPSTAQTVPVVGPACSRPNASNRHACEAVALSLGESTVSFGSDWLILDLASAMPELPNNIKFGGDFQAVSAVTVVGLMIYAGFENVKEDSWLRAPAYGTCAVMARSDACITYGCQAIEGTSGAPVVVPTEDGGIRVAAIHIGSTDYQQAQEACPVNAVRVKTNFQGNAGRILYSLIEPFRE